jgi:raffinose/stachyose/melibiose transport system substrate-binding protein
MTLSRQELLPAGRAGGRWPTLERRTKRRMTMKKNWYIAVALLTLLAVLVGACGATPEPETVVQTVEVEKTVVETVEVEKTVVETVEVEKTVVETQEVEVEVTRVVEVEAAPPEPVDATVMNCEPVDYQGDPATISFVWWVGGGDSPSDKWFSDAVACFQEKYAGVLELDIEYVPGQHDYIEKLKTEYAAGSLPPIVTLKRDPTLAQLWIDNDELIDLQPHFDASPEWQQISLQDSIELNTIDGELLAAPDAWITPIGMFYNTELFAQAGITQFPGSWEAFFDAMEQMKAAGITPLSIHTDDTGWSAILLYEALIARTAEGRDFLNIKFPDEYNLPFMVDATEDLAKLFEYTTPDAIGGVYAMAANNFLSGQTAIMPNGPWMIGDFRDPEKSSEGFGDKVAVALYPGNVAVSDTGRQLGEYAIIKGLPPEVEAGAAEFIKWMRSPEVVRQRVIRLGSTAPNLEMSAEDMAQLDPLAAQLMQLVQVNQAPVLANYQGQWNTIIQNETIVQGLPQLALGNITAEEFLQMLDDAAAEGNP